MRIPLLIFALTAALHSQTNTLTPKEASEGWILLFDGETLFGWTPEGKAKWHVADGAIVADEGEYGWLRSNAPFANFELTCDFRTAADGNSGVFLRSARDGQPHISGYELQIFDQNEKFPTGSLVGTRAATGGKITPGKWQTFHVTFDGSKYAIRLDGNPLMAGEDAKSKVGHIGLQYNKGKKIEFRNIKLRPLELKPLTTGRTLAGWHKVNPEKPAPEPAKWSARKGVIHVEKGPGQLESDKTFADFTLQLDIKTNPKDADHHPNSGVFFRGTPNTWWSGYEVQIRNEYSDGDRKKPIDFGTGAIYRNQPARKIVANDGEWFTETIVAQGRVISVWVNGYPVTSWEDQKAEGTNVRNKEAVLKAGAISLQAHDPTTNLDFRNIRIAELPGKQPSEPRP